MALLEGFRGSLQAAAALLSHQAGGFELWTGMLHFR